MKIMSISRFLVAVLLVGGLISTDAARAEYPEKPITLIIPVGAGGSHDRNARVFTSVIPEFLGNAVIVKLMPGASGQVGTAAAAKAKPIPVFPDVGSINVSPGFIFPSFSASLSFIIACFLSNGS